MQFLLISSSRSVPRSALALRRTRPSTCTSASKGVVAILVRPSTTYTTSSASAYTHAQLSQLQQLPPPAPAATATGSISPHTNILPLSFLQNPTVAAALPYIGNLSYVALASGFLMSDMLTLRLALVGGYTGLVGFHLMHTRPLRIPLRWSAMFVLVNGVMAMNLIADQSMGDLSDEDRQLYDEHFSMLSPGQFQQLLAMARTETVPKGTGLTEEGVPSHNLYFIRKGSTKVFLKQVFAKTLGQGCFVNDVAFQQGNKDEGAYGTVVTAQECTILIWDKAGLRQYLEQRPSMNQNMKYCLATHLVKALLQHREAAHATSGQWRKESLKSYNPRKTVVPATQTMATAPMTADSMKAKLEAYLDSLNM